MQFSIARLLLVTLFVSFVLAATFAVPLGVGFRVLTFVSLFVIPPFIVVGVVQTRGIRQSFFLGAMVTGIPHFLVCVYLVVIVAFSFGDLSDMFDDTAEFAGLVRLFHPIGYLLGAIGGGCGMAASAFYKFGERPVGGSQAMPGFKSDSTLEKDLVMSDEKFSFSQTDAPESSEPEKREVLPPR